MHKGCWPQVMEAAAEVGGVLVVVQLFRLLPAYLGELHLTMEEHFCFRSGQLEAGIPGATVGH